MLVWLLQNPESVRMHPLAGQSKTLILCYMLKSAAFFLQSAHMGDWVVTSDIFVGSIGMGTSIFDLRLLWTVDPSRFDDPGFAQTAQLPIAHR